MRKALSAWMLALAFALLSVAASALQITHDPSSDVSATETTATVTWLTDEPSNSTVLYGAGAELNQSASSPQKTTTHSVTLNNLLPGQEYSYKIISNATEAGPYTFTTPYQNSSFLALNPLPRLTNKARIVVSGTAVPRSRILIYVNRELNPSPRIDRKLGSNASFSFRVNLDSTYTHNSTTGWNEITVTAISPDRKRDTKRAVVVLDVSPPLLVVSDIPSVLTKAMAQSFAITGVTEPGAELTVQLNNDTPALVDVGENGTFAFSASLSRRKKVSIRVAAVDSANNSVVYEKEVKVDDTVPQIRLQEIPSVVHFKILRIEGETEPFAKITATNMGEYAKVDQFRAAYGNGTRLSLLLDPAGLLFGKTTEATADADGKFSILVNLMRGVGNKPGENHIWFNVSDEAGNYDDSLIQAIRYQPDCSVWEIGEMRTYPLSIFSNYWNSGDVTGGVYFTLHYRGREKPTQVTVTPRLERVGDQGLVQGIINEEAQNLGRDITNRYPVRPGSPKVSPYDEKTGTVFVYFPLIIGRNNQKPSDMPDQLQVRLQVNVQYSVEGESVMRRDRNYVPETAEPCQLYPLVSFDVQKPVFLTKWLSPKTINKTIDFLETAIDVTSKAQSVVRAFTYGATGACGLLYFANAVGLSKAKDSCPKTTYWVCDRVMCPDVPEKDPGKDFSVRGKNTFQRTLEEDGNRKKTQTLRLFKKEQSTDIQRELTSRDDWIKYNDALRDEPDCKTVVIEKIVENLVSSKGDLKVTEAKNVQLNVKCVNLTYEELVKTTSNNRLTSESQQLLRDVTPSRPYDPDCPQFDRSKCLAQGVYGVSPADDFIYSLECGCLPALDSHLRGFVQVLGGMKKCMQQAYIGEIYGGACERLLAQFVCNFAEQAIRAAVPSLRTTSRFYPKKGERKNFDKNEVAKTRKNIEKRYSGILDKRLGLSRDSLANSFCVAAITSDWTMLEAALDTFIEATPTKPMYTFSAESRPFGFDPTTGMMTIAYNIYAGIVPTADIRVRAWLECDFNRPGAEFCGKGAEPLPVSQLNFQLGKGDPLFDRNIIEVVPQSKYWYNTLKVEVEYTLSTGAKKETIIKPIKRYGTIAAECSFDFNKGFRCFSPFGTTLGIVRLYPDSSLSPKGVTYYPENTITYKAVIDNEAGEDFLLKFTLSGSDTTGTPWNFETPVLIKGGDEEKQTYVLPLHKFGTAKAPGTTVKEYYNDIVFEPPLQNVKAEQFTIAGAILAATLEYKDSDDGETKTEQVYITPEGMVKWPFPTSTGLYEAVFRDRYRSTEPPDLRNFLFKSQKPGRDWSVKPKIDKQQLIKKIWREYGFYIERAAKENNVPAGVMLALIATESRGYPLAGKNNDETSGFGIAQFIRTTAENEKFRKFFGGGPWSRDENDPRADPVNSIFAMGVHLKNDLALFKDVNPPLKKFTFAAISYNAGYGEKLSGCVNSVSFPSNVECITKIIKKEYDDNKVKEVKSHIKNFQDFYRAYERIRGDLGDYKPYSTESFTAVALRNMGLVNTGVQLNVEPTLTVQRKQYTLAKRSESFQEYLPSGKYSLSVDVLTAQGDQQILYDAKPQTLTYTFSYNSRVKPGTNKIDTSCTVAPKIELVEPASDYVLPDKAVPIGFTFADDCESLSYILVKVQEINGDFLEAYAFENNELTNQLQQPPAVADAAGNSRPVSFSSPGEKCDNKFNLVQGPGDNKANFFRIIMNPAAPLKPGAKYRITVTAWDNEVKASNYAQKTVTVINPSTRMFKEDYMYAFIDTKEDQQVPQRSVVNCRSSS